MYNKPFTKKECFCSPHTKQVYRLNIPEIEIPKMKYNTSNLLPKLLGRNDEIYMLKNSINTVYDNDHEHKSLLTAICDAILNSREQSVMNYNYDFSNTKKNFCHSWNSSLFKDNSEVITSLDNEEITNIEKSNKRDLTKNYLNSKPCSKGDVDALESKTNNIESEVKLTPVLSPLNTLAKNCSKSTICNNGNAKASENKTNHINSEELLPILSPRNTKAPKYEVFTTLTGLFSAVPSKKPESFACNKSGASYTTVRNTNENTYLDYSSQSKCKSLTPIDEETNSKPSFSQDMQLTKDLLQSFISSTKSTITNNNNSSTIVMKDDEKRLSCNEPETNACTSTDDVFPKASEYPSFCINTQSDLKFICNNLQGFSSSISDSGKFLQLLQENDITKKNTEQDVLNLSAASKTCMNSTKCKKDVYRTKYNDARNKEQLKRTTQIPSKRTEHHSPCTTSGRPPFCRSVKNNKTEKSKLKKNEITKWK